MAKNNVNLAGIVIKFSKTNANLNMTKMTEDLKALNRIKKNKIIIISDTYSKEIRPICLFEV